MIDDIIKYIANYTGRYYSNLDECKVPRAVEFSARCAKLREDKTQIICAGCCSSLLVFIDMINLS